MKIVAITLIAASLLVSCGGKEKTSAKEDKKDSVIKTEVTSANAGDLTIGYYDVEKLATDFDFYRNMSAEIEKEGAQIQKELENWQRAYETAATQLQKGMSGGTLMSDKIDQLDKKVKQAENNIISIQQNQMAAFQRKQMEVNSVLEKKLFQYSEEYAKANGIKMLYAKGAGSGIAYIDSAFDVTTSFIQYINAREKEIDAIAN